MGGRKKTEAKGSNDQSIETRRATDADPARYWELWLEVARKAIEQVSGIAITLERPAATAAARPLCVWSEFKISGEIQGSLAFGIPADSRELPQAFAPMLRTTGNGGKWQDLVSEIGAAWCRALEEQLGVRCRLEQSERAKALQEGSPHENFFALMRSGEWALPVWLAVDLRPVQSDASGALQGSKRNNAAVDAISHEVGHNLDLLLDIELQASLRFGSREMALHEVLDLNTGDVVSLDRTIHAPVDLVVGDRIVARGQVVLVNGNYGLRVTEVAEPRKRLETIRCLF
ncbi:MAG TPA: FliM/FliN family flagellar motor switch protein [Acidobacteriaceae bacterium]|nr:FliM/FliN family flagellar motor switch protein [Acidobacteriaceae bacterium]